MEPLAAMGYAVTDGIEIGKAEFFKDFRHAGDGVFNRSDAFRALFFCALLASHSVMKQALAVFKAFEFAF